MPSGWTRWLLERFEFPFRVVPAGTDKGGLREKFDVLLLVDARDPQLRSGGSSAAATGRTRRRAATRTWSMNSAYPPSTAGGAAAHHPGKDDPAHQEVPGRRRHRHHHRQFDLAGEDARAAARKPPGDEERRRQGNTAAAREVLRPDERDPRDRQWTRRTRWRGGFGQGSGRDVRRRPRPSNFPGQSEALKSVAWYAGATTLRSGWAWGQERLDGGVAIVDAEPSGKGRIEPVVRAAGALSGAATRDVQVGVQRDRAGGGEVTH